LASDRPKGRVQLTARLGQRTAVAIIMALGLTACRTFAARDPQPVRTAVVRVAVSGYLGADCRRRPGPYAVGVRGQDASSELLALLSGDGFEAVPYSRGVCAKSWFVNAEPGQSADGAWWVTVSDQPALHVEKTNCVSGDTCTCRYRIVTVGTGPAIADRRCDHWAME
jgi:hypothetical protein